MQNWAAIVLIAGAILFFMAAFSPVSTRVFRVDIAPQEQIQIVTDDRTGWVMTSILFGAGSVVAAIGLFLFARTVSSTVESSTSALAHGAAIIAFIGALFWVIVNVLRIAHTPEQVFLEGSLLGGWLFPLYTVMTQAALIAVGYVLLQTGFSAWLGWGMIVLVSLTVLAMIIFRDMPPFVHYVWVLVMGITMLFSTSTRIAPAAASIINPG
jgi:hypothetical protein